MIKSNTATAILGPGLAVAFLVAQPSPAPAAGMANAIFVNAIAPNALADNALADNALADNALADNALADNALADNALADNALADNGIGHSGVQEGRADPAGNGGRGLEVLGVELPHALGESCDKE